MHSWQKMTLNIHYTFAVTLGLLYTSRFLLTRYVGLILSSTAVATTSHSTVEGTMKVLCIYCMHSSLSASCHSSIRVPS